MSAIKHHHHHHIEANQRPKTRPILFTADMVSAIFDGRKTQTRRILKWRDKLNNPDWYQAIHPDGGGNWIAWSNDRPDLAEFTKKAYPNGEGFKCPYGYPGDHLWVRETWRWFDAMEESDQDGVYSGYQYRADVDSVHDGICWRPSIHMPRAAARLHLQITDIRAQRLHDITEADAVAEGIQSGGDWSTAPTILYSALWEKINGPQSWDANPWVWVITFKVL